MTKSLTKAERAMFAMFTADFPLCWACGIRYGTNDLKIDYPRHLERAHIIGGAGRVHDRRNLASLCKLCHDLSHGAVVRTEYGRSLPQLRRDHLLWLKGRFDKIDRAFLREIGGRIMPPAVIVPRWFQTAFFGRHRRTHQEWTGKGHSK